MASKRPTARNYHNVLRGWWKDKWFDSSWELALIVYCHDHGIELTRNLQKFPYTWKRRTEWYQPDFRKEDGHFIEVKGILDNRSKRKIASFPYPLEVYGAKEMKPYLDYVKSTYGDDWAMTLIARDGKLEAGER